MVEVKLHDIGEGMTEADINTFLVNIGDRVKADDPLVEVQTDKMTAEIPAPKSGVVKQFLVQPGETVTVGTTILIIEESSSGDTHQIQENTKFTKNHQHQDNTAVTNVHQTQESTTVTRTHQPNEYSTVAKKTKRILASPYTRKIARDHQVNIELISGSGVAGRITDEDVYAYIQSLETQKPIENIKPIKETPPLITTKKNTIPFRGRRKQIAKKMTQSLYTIPHCTHFEEIDVTNLIQFRQELKEKKIQISATAYFIKALSIALKEFPIFNARLNEDQEEIELISEHHIGIAVDTEEGLIVPVIKHAEQKSLKQIHLEMKELTEKALNDQLTVKDITGGTFTISNVGPLGGSLGATPIIQHPQVALVSFHKTKKMPVVTDDDQIVIRSIMNVSMSFDHRVADGATAVKFTNRLAELIQNPKMLLLELV
ncbi:dihydrolipoamide acetyltransferase family protein [Bacillus sp. 31A1R]|uniref:Dihydrolipoamide acetyltransferase component of pyruvate dehydrogenase complex n=1 Tax=Robertmurraya mangrovi TaxID=3098077 RepID=A0ABU5J0A6_9BACI|nr:dihydrolipoamide acetyltransferase family protein [Bacillus sp. 31A1R]MDZ5472777.1 dihydrolipoamide acetyltransferase family protein [Bacillus sp. 31A1R]